MADELRRQIDALLETSGTAFRWLPKRGRHRSLEIQTSAGPRRLFLPCTPGPGGRSILNNLALVKRALRQTP